MYLLIKRYHLPVIMLLIVSLLSACLFEIGDTDSVKEASELAIDCKTDEALAAVDRASQGGGLGAGIADLLRVAILRDAGRSEEADAAMALRNERWKVDDENAAEAEKSVVKTVSEIRSERQKRTGEITCD